MTIIRTCTSLHRLTQEQATHPVVTGGGPQVPLAPAHAAPQAVGMAEALLQPSPADRVQNLEELPRQLEAFQRFMQYYVTSAPHARDKAVQMPKMDWAPVAVGAYTGMEWDSVLARSDGIDSVMLVSMVMDGFVGTCADINHRLKNGECFFGPFGAFWSSLAVLGFETGYNSCQANLGARFNGNVNLSASDHIALGQRLTGGDTAGPAGFEAARIRSHLSLHRDAPAFRADVSSVRALGICGAWGLSAMTWIRALCRIDYTSSYDISYSTWTSGIAGRLLSMDGLNVFQQWVTNTWQTIWSGSKITIPKVTAPECLAPGDVLRATFNHRYGKLFSIGSFWMYGGQHNLHVDQTKIVLEREIKQPAPSANKADASDALNDQATADILSIKVSAQNLASRRWFTVISGGAGADTGKHVPDETTFSMRLAYTPANISAYQVFIKAIRKAQSVQAHEDAVKVFVETTGTTYEKEQVTGRISSSEMGVRVGLFPMTLWGDWVPRGFSWGLGDHTQTSHMKHATASVKTDYFLNQHMKLRGPDGDRTTDAVAVVRRAATTDEKDSGAVVLSTRIRLSRADNDEVSRLIIDPLAQMYGAHLAPLTGAGWRVSREVSFEQCLDSSDFVRLAEVSDECLARCAQAAGCEAQPLLIFVSALRRVARSNENPSLVLDACVDTLGPYLTATGAPGVAAIYRAMGRNAANMADNFNEKADTAIVDEDDEGPNLIVRSHSDAYNRPRALLDTLYLRYHDADASKRKAMQAAIKEAQNEILVTADFVRQDSFLDAGQKNQWLAECAACARELTRMYFQADHAPAAPELSQFALDLQNFSTKYDAVLRDESEKTPEAAQKSLAALRADMVRILPLPQSTQDADMLRAANDRLLFWESLAV